MGSGPSKKKIAPACVSEVNMTKTAAGATSPKQEGRSFKPLRVHAALRNARSRAQPDRHSEGRGSDLSAEDDDTDGELDAARKDYGERERVSAKKNPPRKTFMKSKTYGLCHFSREDTEDELSSAPRPRESERAEEPRGSQGGSGHVNKRNNDAFTRFKKHTPQSPSRHNSSSQGFLTRGASLEAVPTSEKQSSFGSCHGPSPAMPVILYDGSEEELMDTIEREFT
ncbi:uncharacterized protein [Trachinotus anak]|uniref:uncharacterized protein n=1 Tax=Trachinotus anak TaxID=443729 RepID=UPI0039F25936